MARDKKGIDWKIVLGSALLTMVALFGLQEWYRSYMLVTAGTLPDGEVGAEVAAQRAAQREQLESGSMPIDRAMQVLADRGRRGSPLVTPEPSTEPAPAAGWLHHPDYEAPPAPLPPEPEPEAPAPEDGSPADDAASPEPAQPAVPAP